MHFLPHLNLGMTVGFQDRLGNIALPDFPKFAQAVRCDVPGTPQKYSMIRRIELPRSEGGLEAATRNPARSL